MWRTFSASAEASEVRRFLNKKPTAPVSVKLAIRQYPLCSFHLVGQSRRLSFSGTLWNTEVSLTASMAASPPSIFSKMHVTAHPGFSALWAESPTVCVISDTTFRKMKMLQLSALRFHSLSKVHHGLHSGEINYSASTAVGYINRNSKIKSVRHTKIPKLRLTWISRLRLPSSRIFTNKLF